MESQVKMYRFIRAVLIILVIETLQFSVGYKWISLQSGDKIPEGTIYIDEGLGTYVGRARHYDELLPAEVYNSSYALILSCSKEIVKHEFEVLVASELCKWERFYSISHIPENIVRAGNEADGQPIYVASTTRYSYYPIRLAYISLLHGRILKWTESYELTLALLCDDINSWEDTSSKKIPNNTISGGHSADGHEIFVARLKRGCNIVPGQVIPDLGTATAVYEGKDIESTYCQVLVGDQNNYSWVWAYDGEIPDYAVVNGKSAGGELRYVARMNNNLSYIEHNRAKIENMAYEVLVKSYE